MFRINLEDIKETRFYQHCFDVVDVFIVALNLKGNVILLNKKAREILELDQDADVNVNFIENFISGSQRDFIQKNLLDETQKPKEIFSRYTLQTQKNNTRVIEGKNVKIYDNNNNYVGILLSGKDVTAHLQSRSDLKKDINLYRVLVNNIPEINILLFDRNLRILMAEGTEMKNIGLNRNDFYNKKIYEIPHRKLSKILTPLFEKAVKGKKITKEYKLDHYHYLLRIANRESQEGYFYSGIAVIRNITAEKQSEYRLDLSRKEAEASSSAKNNFLAKISHDIRTPLNAILGFTEQLLHTELNDKQKEYTRIIDHSSEHLLSLIDDILVLSKIEAGQISFEKDPFKINYVVKYVFSTMQARAQEKKLKLSYDIDSKLDIVLIGDAFRLQQILINMLSNAIKFTNSGYVELRCFAKEESEHRILVRFDIIDTGMGISDENLKSIFENYHQAAKSISKRYGGTGLGLNICKNLVELQEGSLSVSSTEGLGSTFTFTIPYEKGSPEDLIPEHSLKIDFGILKDKKFLLVDDDSVNRLLGKIILEKFQCVFDVARNGEEAIEKLDNNNYHAVLLDIHMPGISGIEVANYLRRDKKDKNTKIIALTAAALKDDIKSYYKAEINDFLIKPFKEVNLYNKICEVLKLKKSIEQKPKSEIILKDELSPKAYNLAGLRKMANDDTGFITEMISTFIKNSEDAIQKFKNNLNGKDWKQIGETAHKILPSYRHLEVEGIVPELIKIKTLTLEEQKYEQIPQIVNNTIEEMEKVILALNRELDNGNNDMPIF